MADNTGTGEGDGARLLASVREALAGWPDLGSHPRISVDQWNGFTVDGKRAYGDIGIAAIRRVTGYRAVADQLRALGRLRYEPAVPTLAELWEHCPVEPIRTAAAHALFGIGTSEARAALRAGVYDHDDLARFMAVKTMFTDEGPSPRPAAGTQPERRPVTGRAWPSRRQSAPGSRSRAC